MSLPASDSRSPGALEGIAAMLLAAGQEAKSKRFVQAWLGWRGERPLPLRSALDLLDVKQQLRLVMLTEVRGADEIMVRVCGTQLSQYLGFELTGRNMLALTPPADRPIRHYRFSAMANRPCGAVFEHHHVMPSGRLYPTEVIMLPIDPDDPAKPRLLMHNFAPLKGDFTSEAVPEGQAVPLSRDFRFLDIGFGIPDRTAP